MRRAGDWFRRRIGMSRRTGTRTVVEQRRVSGTLLADWAARLVVPYPYEHEADLDVGHLLKLSPCK